MRKANVLLSSRGTHPFARHVVSDVNGGYAIEGIPPGSYNLSIQRDGLLPAAYGARRSGGPGKSLILSPGQQIGDLNFALEPPGVISGRVLDGDGEPVPGASIQALRRDWNRGLFVPAATASTNDIGEYRLFGLPAGRYYVVSRWRPAIATGTRQPGEVESIYPSTFYPGTIDFASAATLNVAAGGEARDIDIRVLKSKSAAVRGIITNLPGSGYHPLSVQIANRDHRFLDSGNVNAGILTGGAGEFEFRNLAAGSYRLFASLQEDKGAFYAAENIEIADMDLNGVRLALSPGMDIPGTLRFVGGPDQSSKVSVSLSPVDWFGREALSLPSEDQSFHLKGITPGSWRATVSLARAPDAYVQSIRLGDQDGLTGNLEIRRDTKDPLQIIIGAAGGALEGTVRTAGDQPRAVEMATVLVLPVGEKSAVTSYAKTAVTDVNGHYRLRGLAPGKYRIFAFEDIDPFAYRNSDFVKSLDGKGREISISIEANTPQDLTCSDAP